MRKFNDLTLFQSSTSLETPTIFPLSILPTRNDPSIRVSVNEKFLDF